MKSMPGKRSLFTTLIIAGLLLVLAGFASIDNTEKTTASNYWEYKVITITDGYADEQLNTHVAAMGWECVGINEGRAVFRRLLAR